MGHDGSAGAAKALSAAIALARQHNGELHMISVEELQRIPATIDEIVEEETEARRRLQATAEAARALARAQNVALVTHIVAGHPVSAIVDFIGREGFDLLIVGFMGHSALYNRLIGSTTDRLVELAPCAVLVIK
jgi:nucleotide-binding universal stress UspA family protein